MSTSIPIPRRGKQQPLPSHDDNTSSPASGSSYTASSYADSSSSWSSTNNVIRQEQQKGKDKQRASTGSIEMNTRRPERRPSLLSEEISRAEHIVIDVGGPGHMRLVSCVKASQGFDWNPEIFLPSSYAERGYGDELERRHEPVKDIILTDEEIANMFPS